MIGSRTCAHCEYFHGGGQARVLRAIRSDEPLPGDCLNSRSPRLQTYSHETCPEFYEDPAVRAALSGAAGAQP